MDRMREIGIVAGLLWVPALLVALLAASSARAQTFTDTSVVGDFCAVAPCSGNTYATVAPGTPLQNAIPGIYHSDGNDFAANIAIGDGRGVDGNGDITVYFTQPVKGVGVRYVGNAQITVYDTNLQPIHTTVNFGADVFGGTYTDEPIIQAAVINNPFLASTAIDDIFWLLPGDGKLQITVTLGGAPVQAYVYLIQGEDNEVVQFETTVDGQAELLPESGRFGIYVDGYVP